MSDSALSSTSSLQLIEKLCNAFDCEDLDQIMDCFADDCVYEDFQGPAPNGQVYSGKKAVRDCFAALFKNFPNLRSEKNVPIALGNVGAMEYTLIAPGEDGQRVRACDFFEFDDQGLVTRKSTWLKSIDQQEPA